MTPVPEWRQGAAYFRALTDEKGLPTGREVTVYEELFGQGKLCEGPLGDEIGFDQYWVYPDLAEAMAAASEWDGCLHPPGKWKHYGMRDQKMKRELFRGLRELSKSGQAAADAMRTLHEAMRRVG